MYIDIYGNSAIKNAFFKSWDTNLFACDIQCSSVA